jgi:hypothetical protein
MLSQPAHQETGFPCEKSGPVFLPVGGGREISRLAIKYLWPRSPKATELSCFRDAQIALR